MNKILSSLVLAAGLLLAKGSGAHAAGSYRSSAGHHRAGHRAPSRIQRSRAQIRKFEKSHPCPATGKTSGACPGYIIDHIVPLKRGGPDEPGNMQWQTAADAKAKDKVE